MHSIPWVKYSTFELGLSRRRIGSPELPTRELSFFSFTLRVQGSLVEAVLLTPNGNSDSVRAAQLQFCSKENLGY